MERMRERKQERIPKFLCKVLLGNFQIQFFSQEANREREREREREGREFSKCSHLVWRMVEQNENGFSRRVNKDFIRKLVF